MEKQKYMNPITLEAELFASNFKHLSKVYKNIDEVLVASLEKVVRVIEAFLDSNPTDIVQTKNTQLVKCEDFSHINRIYYCVPCRQDLGKSAEKATLHMINKCKRANRAISVKELELQRLRSELRMTSSSKKQSVPHDPHLAKKTRSVLISDLSKFVEDQPKICQKLTCLPAYDVIKDELKKLITPEFPCENIKIYTFGSRIAGIGNPESDLDLYIDIGDTFSVFEHRVNVDTLLKLNKVCRALKNDNKSWKGLVKIEKARVPILKVVHASTGIECDINFSHSLGTINTKFLEFIFNLQPIAQMLCAFMKKWVNSIKFSDEINSYSISLMVLFYLQTMDVLPSMARLQENIKPEKALRVGPWICTYSVLSLDELKIPLTDVNESTLLKLVRGFFLFYTNFNFKGQVICPYLGKAIRKDEVQKLMPLRYKEYVKQNNDYELQLDKPIVVQDPIQLNHNTTKNLGESTIRNFESYMISALETIV